MKGLLYKSWLNVKPVATYYIIFVVVFFLVSLLNGDPLYFAAICVMIGVAVPLASMTSDDKDGWEKFAVAAGISRARFALGRYLFALFCQLPGWLLSGLLVLLCEDKLAALATRLIASGGGGDIYDIASFITGTDGAKNRIALTDDSLFNLTVRRPVEIIDLFGQPEFNLISAIIRERPCEILLKGAHLSAQMDRALRHIARVTPDALI